MKKVLIFFLLLGLGKANAQRINEYDYDKVRITDTSQEVQAEVLPFDGQPKLKNDRFYFWYNNNAIHSTQGGFDGQLLNGHYIAYYPDKTLKEEGEFKKGLKHGEWKTWNHKGELLGVVKWEEGMVVPDQQVPFWKRLPFLKKKDTQPTPAKPVPGQ
jgi:hypothetical protein